MGKSNKKKNEIVEPRINYEIKGYKEVRLIYKEHNDSVSENDFNKVVSWYDAVGYSKKYGLDLIEINAKTEPPIIRLGDYSKYLYELKKQQKHKNKNTSVVKEIQLSTNISLHDLEIKAKHALEFIEDGNKVKVILTMKGRELLRREESKKSFLKFLAIMLDSGKVSFDCPPRDEEKKCFTILKRK